MAQTSVNERIKFLIDSLGVSTRKFSELVGESYSNMNNYVSERQSMPPASLLEKLLIHFENLDPKWLIAGIGKPFPEGALQTPTIHQTQKKTKGSTVIGTNHGDVITNIEECRKERDTYKNELEMVRRDAASYQREIELLKGQLETKDNLIASKDELLNFLRGGFNRPN